jgi:hypothetical protein
MRRLTYANVTATLALVFAMSGGALAANHYLIHSTKQISPKVLKKLHGARGRTGPNGAIGPQGVKGDTGGRGQRGQTGEPGFSALAPLPTGETESGEFSVSIPSAASGATLTAPITFPVRLVAGFPKAQIDDVPIKEPDTNCTLPGGKAKGFLCIYTSTGENVQFEGAFNPETAPMAEGTGRFGAVLKWKVTGEGSVPATVTGTWTLTGG